ncbi:hypothetical protein PTSG_00360 [Salpingoeca rosetta]|uniref:Sulfotransferase domain-containing protein n=1 Tax=Salpingoeca rosetta (strain ATCC 50818 / BSB-021) TaxID=946362 RepID=F2TW93_SALR5|nr:uncharacterized protein PTSG_00360 [Salpingoeca rosetta]EGD72339.1 hypothetical protein PTSG_00360 [Salpingoeca rosetta]|eukprot:XP_004998909.1 hypothetical protein PTSG_00360 [Salpingoeca rosetta]
MAISASEMLLRVATSRLTVPKMRFAAVLHGVVGLIILLACHMLVTTRIAGKIQYARTQTAELARELESLNNQLEALEGDTAKLQIRAADVNKRIQEWSAQRKQRAHKHGHASSQHIVVGAENVHEVELQGFQRNRVVMDGPYCTPMTAPKKPLPKFVFVAGVEGSGHHALLSVWEKLKEDSVPLELIVYDQVFHQLGVENHASYHYSRISLEEREAAMRPVFEHAAQRGATVIDAQNSYPMGQFAGSLAHPDLLQLAKLDGKLFDLRVIVLYRNPTDAVLSAVRRFRSEDGPSKYKNSQFQARMVAESLVAINNALPHLSCGKWTMLQYEDFVHNPRLLAGPFARLLGLPKSAFDSSLANVHAPPKRTLTHAVQEEQRLLDEFFSRQAVLWPLLASAAKQSTTAP